MYILNCMNLDTAHKLNKATSEFYAAHAESFSNTRERPWPGWANVLEYATPGIERTAHEGRPYRVLDIGCGNLRFEKMLIECVTLVPGTSVTLEFFGVDNCPSLALDFAQEAHVHYQRLDVIESLEKGTLASELDAPPCDLVVAFGFMHHIPLPAWREELLKALIQRTAPGGIIAIAFWQFANDEKAKAKALHTTELVCDRLGITLDKEAGDYLLGWQRDTKHFRYCHSFFDDEIAELANAAQNLGAMPITSFSADGPDGKSNRYLILKW